MAELHEPDPGSARDGFLVRRCAWCNRILTVRGWEGSEVEQPRRETATICPRCTEKLRAAGLSR
jgi:hypothetical protein